VLMMTMMADKLLMLTLPCPFAAEELLLLFSVDCQLMPLSLQANRCPHNLNNAALMASSLQ